MNAFIWHLIYGSLPNRSSTYKDRFSIIYIMKVELPLNKETETFMLGITHLFPHNEVVHLPYIAVATNTQSRLVGEQQLLIGIVLERWRLEIAQDHFTCYRNNRSQFYRWTISLFCIH